MTNHPPNPPLLKNHWANEAAAHSVPKPVCNCLDPQYEMDEGDEGQARPWPELAIHTDVQDTQCDAWQRLN